MSVVREPASSAERPEPAAVGRPRHPVSRAIAILAILGLAALGGYQLMLMGEAVKAAAAAAWTTGEPSLAQAWIAVQSMWHTVVQAMVQVH